MGPSGRDAQSKWLTNLAVKIQRRLKKTGYIWFRKKKIAMRKTVHVCIKRTLKILQNGWSLHLLVTGLFVLEKRKFRQERSCQQAVAQLCRCSLCQVHSEVSPQLDPWDCYHWGCPHAPCDQNHGTRLGDSTCSKTTGRSRRSSFV